MLRVFGNVLDSVVASVPASRNLSLGAICESPVGERPQLSAHETQAAARLRGTPTPAVG